MIEIKANDVEEVLASKTSMMPLGVTVRELRLGRRYSIVPVIRIAVA